MPHYLVELYTPKPTWLALAPGEKQHFFGTIGTGMASLAGLGIEVVAGRTSQRVDTLPTILKQLLIYLRRDTKAYA